MSDLEDKVEELCIQAAGLYDAVLDLVEQIEKTTENDETRKEKSC